MQLKRKQSSLTEEQRRCCVSLQRGNSLRAIYGIAFFYYPKLTKKGKELRIGNYIQTKFNNFIRKAVSADLRNSLHFKDLFTDYFTNAKQTSSWVSDCCDVHGKSIMKADFDLYDVSGKEKVEVDKHPIIDIFTRPNPFQYWGEILYNIGYQAGLYGESFLYKLRDGLGIVRGLLMLPNASVEIKSLNSYLDSYSVAFRSGTVEVSPLDMIHLRYPNPNVNAKGKAIISNILDTVEVDRLQTEYQKKFFQKGGFMGLTFSTDANLSADSFRQKAKQFSEAYGGVSKAFKVGLLDSGFKPINPSHTIKDMDISAQRNLTRDEILAAFQVSKFQLGMGESINRATAKENAMRFASDVIEPLLSLYDDIFTHSLCKNERGWEYLEIQHESTSPRDLETDSEWYKTMRESGAITPNEVRVYEDMEPLEDERMDIPLALMQKLQTQPAAPVSTNENEN